MSAEDDRQARILRATALGVGKWLEEKRMLEKRIGQMSLEELEGLTNASVTSFMLEWAKEATAEERMLGPIPQNPLSGG